MVTLISRLQDARRRAGPNSAHRKGGPTNSIEVHLGGEVLPNLKINAVATFLHALAFKNENIHSQLGGDLLGAPRRVYNLSANYI